MTSQPAITTNRRPLDDEAVQGFVARIRGEVIQPSDPRYDDARMVWNGMIDRRPAMMVRPTGNVDVIEAVNFARGNGLPIAVRGGGHNVAGTAVADDALVIDLSLMRSVHVDPQARTVRVQGGATWGDVDRETQVYGLATTGGVVSQTGVAGLTLHGGMGHLRRKYGLSVDNLLSVDIVTADGQVRTASEAENADLFWAVRGAGSNFGIVTSFEFQLHPVGPEVYLCAPVYAAEDGPAILPKWREFMESAPDEISSIALFWSVPDGFPEEFVGRPVLILAAVHAGSAEAGERETQPLREMGTPILDLSAAEHYTEVQTGFDPFFPDGKLYYWKSLLTDELTDEMIDQLCQLGANRPAPGTTVEMWHHGGAMHRMSAEDTSYGGRGANFMLTFEPGWTDPAESERNIAWAREAWAQMYPYASKGLYLNFPGFGEEKEDLVRKAYGPNYQRLTEIKATFDPDNLFRFNQNITPAKTERLGI